MLRLYNCTRIYIVKYRQSIVFHIIYIGGHFSVARARESHKRPQKVAQVASCCHFEQHDVFINISVVRTTASDKDRSAANLGKHAVSFAACLVCGFLTFNLRSTAQNNGQE